MENLAAIGRELDALERVQAELATIATREDPERKRDLVALRRQLSSQIAEIGRQCEPLLDRYADVATAQTYRSKFSAMRSAAAVHQASWPAVLLDDRPEEYRASAQRVRDANKEFVAWMRNTLAQLRPSET